MTLNRFWRSRGCAHHDEVESDRHLADLTGYGAAQQRMGELYGDPEAWTRKFILNIAASGKFSSDRTIAEYANEIWNVKACSTE